MEPISSPDTSEALQGDRASHQSGIPTITIRGSSSPVAKAAQKFLSQAEYAELIQGLGSDAVVSVVIECKKVIRQISLEVKKDLLCLSIPPRGLSEHQLTQDIARVLIGFAITQTAIQAAEHFAARGVECPVQSEKLAKLLRQYSAFENGPRQDKAVLLSKALAPHRGELERRRAGLLDKPKMSPSPSLDSLSAGHEAFCQKVDSFRAISELLGNTLGLQDVITDKLRDRLVVFNDLFARRVFHGDYDAGQAVINAVDVLNQRVQASGWFKQFPRVLQPAKIDLGEIQRQRTLLNTSLWGDDASAAGMTSHQPSQLTNRRSVSADLSGMVAALQYALNLEMEFRKIPSEPETGFELVDGLTAVSPLIPAAVVALDSKISAEQLADMDDFLRVLLRIKYCEQPATKNCYEYVVYGIIPDGSVKVEELARADLAMHSHCRLLQCLAFIATNEPGIVGERLKVFQEELMLIAIRAIEATMLNYRACMAAHLKMGNVFDQQSLQIALSDLDAMEEAIQVALNNPLEGRPSFGFEDVLQAVRAVRESYSKAALLALSDRELAVRVEEVLAVNHSGPYADQLHEVSARLTDRMRAYLGTKAEEASAQLESLSQGESIIPIVQYAKEMLTIIRADPTSETSAALKKSIGETLLDMLRVLEDYYTGEIALAAKPKASVEDVYRALDALHHLMLEAGYVRDELSPYAEHLPDLLLSKSQILVQEFPKRLKRDLSAASTLLGEVVQNLAREMASPTDSKERSDPDPLKQRAKSCVQGLRWVCMPRRVLPAPVREAFDSLVGARARGVEFS